MSHRVIASLRAVAVVVAVVSLGAIPAVAQTEAPRTAWGQPDLQGVWDFRTITPMQRPERLADQEFLTAEEAANLDQAAVDRNSRLYNQDAERTEQAPLEPFREAAAVRVGAVVGRVDVVHVVLRCRDAVLERPVRYGGVAGSRGRGDSARLPHRRGVNRGRRR